MRSLEDVLALERCYTEAKALPDAEVVMLGYLQHQCAELDRRSRALLTDLSGLPPFQLSFKPTSRSWSILEVVQHLVLSEQDVIGDARAVSEPRVRRHDLRAYMGYPMVFLVLYYGVPFPVPSTGMIPNGRTSLPELQAQWNDIHHWLRSYVDSLTPETVELPVFYHPLTGPITVKQTLILSQTHLTCHIRQIERIKRAALVALPA